MKITKILLDVSQNQIISNSLWNYWENFSQDTINNWRILNYRIWYQHDSIETCSLTLFCCCASSLPWSLYISQDSGHWTLKSISPVTVTVSKESKWVLWTYFGSTTAVPWTFVLRALEYVMWTYLDMKNIPYSFWIEKSKFKNIKIFFMNKSEKKYTLF